MVTLHIPDGPFMTGAALHRGRGPRLTRAESFHPDEQKYLEGPEFEYSPLRLDFSHNGWHRTIASFTSRYSAPSQRRSISSDHVRKSDYQDRNSNKYVSFVSRVHNEVPRHAFTGKKKSRKRGTNFNEIPFRLNTLCNRCQSINIESLSVDGGYVHSSLKVMEEQAKTCKMCQIIFNEQDTGYTWTMDRYQIVLSLQIHLDDTIHSDHSSSESPGSGLKRVLWIDTVDTRPHEIPEGKRGQLYHSDDSGKYTPNPNFLRDPVVRGRPLLCYTDENDPARVKGVPWLRAVGENTASDHSLKIAKGWLEKCLETELHSTSKSANRHIKKFISNHLEVPPGDLVQVQSTPQFARTEPPRKFVTGGPARLLVITDPDDVENSKLHLVETDGAYYAYATLSYCWGKMDPTWLCTRSNVDQYLSRIDRKSLPATIRDCIVIAATLGIRYLWIDSLCIIQDSDSDWATEAAKMGAIYHQSLVTIAAAGSSDSGGGCFNRKSQPRFGKATRVHRSRLQLQLQRQRTSRGDQRPDFVSLHPKDRGNGLVCLESLLQSGQKSRLYIVTGLASSPKDGVYDAEVIHSPLSSRAWVFQEQVLSRRTLYFAQSQLFWECEHCRLSEDNWQQRQNDHTYPILAYNEPLSTHAVIQGWYQDTVESYSARNLTQKKDKMIAISAVARATYINRKVEYLAGLWKDCILAGLLWRRSGPGRKSKTYFSPSWSWASQESSVHYGLVFNRSDRVLPIRPEVIEAHVDTDPTNPFGDVKNGYLKLRTLITVGWVMRRGWQLSSERGRRPSTGGSGRSSASAQEFFFLNKSTTCIWRAAATMDDDDYSGHEVKVAFLSNSYRDSVALVLEPVIGEWQTFRRVGILEWKEPPGPSALEAGLPWRQETIRIM